MFMVYVDVFLIIVLVSVSVFCVIYCARHLRTTLLQLAVEAQSQTSVVMAAAFPQRPGRDDVKNNRYGEWRADQMTRSYVQSPLTSCSSGAYEPLPDLARTNHFTVPPVHGIKQDWRRCEKLDNNISRERDWNYTEYQI